MKYSTGLREYTRKRIELIEYADIVVGIPCYNSENTIRHVIRASAKGIAKYYHDARGVVIIADGGSTDDTREIAKEEQLPPYIEKIVQIYRGIPGKGTALRSIFEVASHLNAKACIVCDSDLKSISTEWIKNLAEPVINGGYHFVAPLYTRHKYDGTITNNIIYNLTRALYGKRIRQPIGGDFAFSKEAAKFYLEQDVWQTDVARYGIDIWMTTSAITQNFKVCQARLGVKIHDAKDPSDSLGPMFRQVVTTMFALMEDYEDFWKKVKVSKPVDILGDAKGEEPETIQVDYGRLVENFKVGYNHFGALWKTIVNKKSFAKIEEMSKHPIEEFFLSIDDWVKIVYDFAITFHRWEKNRYKLIDIMTPLYYGGIASFINQTKKMSNSEAEAVVESRAERFEALKSYLLERWGK